MAIRDAGDYGFGLSFEDAVAKGRRDNWSDRDIAALLKCTEEEVTKVPREKVTIRLEDLKFRPDTSEGGTIVEYLVDGRKKPQVVPRVVGEVLEALVKDHLEWVTDYKGIVKQYGDLIVDARERLKVLEGHSDRLATASPGDGVSFSRGPGSRIGGKPKGKAKAHPKA